MPVSDSLQTLFNNDPDRAERCSLRAGPLFADLSRRHIANLEAVVAPLGAADIETRIEQLFRGEAVNRSEKRPALHWACRTESPALPAQFIKQRDATRKRADELAERLRNQRWAGVTGRTITDVVCIGIGGSELGPRLVRDALGSGAHPGLHFIANVDGGPIATLIERLDPERTLLLITSKSFTTSETGLNADTLRSWLAVTLDGHADWLNHHCLAVTARAERAREWGLSEDNILTFPESVGGRYSLWSAAGFPALLALGAEGYEELLAGASEMDEHFVNADLAVNVPALAGALDAQCRALVVVPYDERLALLPEYLQQLYMESLGKAVDQNGAPLPEWNAPLLFGATGPRAQHAFFQTLHQANVDVVTEFIGVIKPDHDLGEHHRALLANMLGQATALAFGGEGEGHRAFPGNRPSNVILLDELNPRSLGALLAHYEHRVFTAAAIAGVNPFDQFGVELGKELAKDMQTILEGAEPPPSLAALFDAINGRASFGQ